MVWQDAQIGHPSLQRSDPPSSSDFKRSKPESQGYERLETDRGTLFAWKVGETVYRPEATYVWRILGDVEVGALNMSGRRPNSAYTSKNWDRSTES